MIFLVDAKNGVPISEPLFTIQMEYVSRCIVGWDLFYDNRSNGVTLRMFHHAGTPKKIGRPCRALSQPERHLREAGFDPARQRHTPLFAGTEDALADVGTSVRYAGAEMPRDKALGERAILTIISNLPGNTYDIRRAREFGYDPEKHATLTIEEAHPGVGLGRQARLTSTQIMRSRALAPGSHGLVRPWDWRKRMNDIINDTAEIEISPDTIAQPEQNEGLLARSGRVAKATAALRRIVLTYPRQIALQAELEELRLTGIERSGMPQLGLTLVDRTGCGKSVGARQYKLFNEARSDLPAGSRPVLHVRMDANGTSRGLFDAISNCQAA